MKKYIYVLAVMSAFFLTVYADERDGDVNGTIEGSVDTSMRERIALPTQL